MPPASHQTIRLARGRHGSPADGACVMELASMLAGESFGDHPASVCPVIGSFVRAYNDAIDDERRQDLYRFASAVVGSRASRAVQRARLERLAAWRIEQRERRTARWPRPLRTLALLASRLDRDPALSAHTLDHSDRTHAAVLALIDELLAIGAPTDVSCGPVRLGGGSADAERLTPAR
jgi:hypothetical protein